MGLGQRIEERRKAIGISQAELARRVGVRQSTMNSLINGDSRSSRSIVTIARELQTTAAYLVGDTDDPHADMPEVLLSRDEEDLLEQYRRAPKSDRDAFRYLLGRLGRPTNQRSATLVTSAEELRDSIRQALSAMPARGRERQADYLTEVLGAVVLPPEDLEPIDEDLPRSELRESAEHTPSPTR